MFSDITADGFKTTIAENVAEQVVSNEAERANLLFIEAVRDGWNQEMDWLWLATKVSLNTQREYCFRRALAINPHSEMAKQGLKQHRR